MIPSSELIINESGTVYHLDLHPSQIAETIITVGDPDRVQSVAERLDSIDFTIQRREFKTVTGRLGSKAVTIISTGIGTDNIDIVLTELDALVNIDFGSRTPKPASKSLTIVRLGTSGAIRPEIEVDSILLSRYAIGLDGLMHFYKISPTIAEEVICEECIYKLENIPHIRPYVTSSDEMLHQAFSALGSSGITITSSGFYGPQGRTLRKPIADVKFIDAMSHIKYGDTFATNLEMETAGIYGMSTMLGHHAISINAILANRSKQIFSKNPSATVSKLIEKALPIIESI